jgi:hypothetical protein
MAQADRRESTNDPARVAVTAAGVISPLGFGLAETLESLRSAQDCVTPVMRFSVTQCRLASSRRRLFVGRRHHAGRRHIRHRRNAHHRRRHPVAAARADAPHSQSSAAHPWYGR